MKKFILYYLLLIFIASCSDESAELTDETSESVIVDITSFAGTNENKTKVGSGDSYALADTEFANIREFHFHKNNLIVLEVDDTYDYIRLIDIASNEVSDQFQIGYFTMSHVWYDANSSTIYTSIGGDLYSKPKGQGDPQFLYDEVDHMYINDDDVFFIEDGDSFGNSVLYKLNGSTKEKYFNDSFSYEPYFISNQDIYFQDVNGIYMVNKDDNIADYELILLESFIDEIVMTKNNNFFYAKDQSGELYYYEKGSTEPVLLTAPGSPYENQFENIKGLAIDNENKILYVGDQSMIYSVKLNRL